mmetsp:Transcript_30694/g.77591  ORF Transcript_30694/g.77591 Transcript_30694/m.77591 type:complete len:209 (+) Transcript_30694:648-1274(+)
MILLDKPFGTFRCRKYLRNSQNCLISSPRKLRRAVMDAVMLATMLENTSMAKRRTTIENKRSKKFLALMSIEAGVNWVRLQCKAVAYKYGEPVPFTPATITQFVPSESRESLAMRYQIHAMTWLKTKTKQSNCTRLNNMKVYSLSILSAMRFNNFLIFKSRNKRKMRKMRRVRASLLTSRAPPPSALTTCIAHSGATIVMSTMNHVKK